MTAPSTAYRRYGKRLLDVLAAAAGLVLLSPLLLALAVMVRIKLGPPVLFRQRRPGLHGNPFVLVKFRTMTEDRDEHGARRPDAEPPTPFGRTMRALSLDELPELYNVLRGEMSLVGPRPLLMHFLDRYDTVQARRHEVLPGITGWAQVNGRRAVSFDRKCEYDVWYVDNVFFWLDVKILCLTAYKVARREGASG